MHFIEMCSTLPLFMTSHKETITAGNAKAPLSLSLLAPLPVVTGQCFFDMDTLLHNENYWIDPLNSIFAIAQ